MKVTWTDIFYLTLCNNIGEGNGNPLQYSPGKSHGPRSLVGYNPWGRKESDTTERLLCVCVCNNIFSFNNIYNVFSHLKHLNI